MEVYLVPSLHSEGLDCIVSFTLTDPDGINGKLRPGRGYRPVPGVPFLYNLDTTALKAEPIPGLCGDFIISFLHREDDLGAMDGLNMTLFSMDLPENSFITIADQYNTDSLKHDKPHYVLLTKHYVNESSNPRQLVRNVKRSYSLTT